MKLIGNFFDKFNNTAIKEIKKRNYIAEIIKGETGIVIPIEKIKFTSSGIKLELNSIEKNQIYIKKQRIIKLISDKVPNIRIKDIN